jgi:methionine synthase II (cobalamin-independent)
MMGGTMTSREIGVNRAQLPSGIATGIGSLPHRDAGAAAAFALSTMALPAIPTLPKRSPAEGMIQQALVGLAGITVGQYGSIAFDAQQVDPLAPIVTDINHDAFGGWRAFLAAAAGHTQLVKWQFVGPVTLGLALTRAGLQSDVAFEVAVRAVRCRVRQLVDHVAAALPGCRQVVFIDEPTLDELMLARFPIPPDAAVDLVSAALAAVEPVAVSGLHVCATADIASLVAMGPDVLSVPVDQRLLESAGYLARFLDDGGTVAWGAVPTEGPIATSSDRPWRRLSDLWCDLVKCGADPARLRQQSMVTPECGLGTHTPAVAERVHRLVTEISQRVRDQAAATRFSLGA